MLIAQISDMHVTAPGSPSLAGADAAATLARCVDHINSLRPAPEVVLATGDLVNDGSAEAYRALVGLLAPLAMPVYLIPGNHDDRDNLRAAFPDHRYLPADGEFLQYVVEDYPLRLIGLDTVVPGEDGGLVCAARRAWLAERLAAAPARPTLIFMHHPPFATGLEILDGMGCAGAEHLGALVAGHPQVERVLCGHVHRPIQTRWHGTLASTAPSTAVQFGLDLGPVPHVRMLAEPLACLLHLWRPESGVVSHLSYVGHFDPPRPAAS